MLLLISVFFPIAYGAVLLFLKEEVLSRKKLCIYTAAGLIAEFLLVFVMLFSGAGAVSSKIVSLSKILTLSLCFDRIGKMFAVVFVSVWVLAGIYSFEYMKHEDHNKRYFAFYLMSLGILMGLCGAENIITFYAFYELMTIATFALVIHNQSKEAIHAALKYLFYSFAGAYMVLFGIYFLYHDTVMDPKIPLFFMILGFSVKAGMFPLHGWLPTAHPVAPAPASAVLSGIIVKAGVLGILRTFLFAFPDISFAGTNVQTVFLILSIITIFMGSMLAYREKLLKKRLAYSTVSQVSYILFGIFAADAEGLAMKGALIHVAAHAAIKCVLFLVAGAIIYHTGCTYVDELRGLGKKMPVLMWCYTIASLGLIGIPPFGGYAGKWYLGLGALAPSGPGVLGVIGVAVLMISALLTAGYLLPISIEAFLPGKDFKEENLTPERPSDTRLGAGNEADKKIFAPAYLKGSEPKIIMLIPVIILTLLSVLIGIFPEVLL